MKGHAIISHGLQSSPEATKAIALAAVARDLGWSVELPDYQDCDQRAGFGQLGDIGARIERLDALAARADALLLVDDSHRLAAHAEACAQEFGRFLQALA